MHYTNECKALLGQLIGVARATDGNEHLIDPHVTSVIMEALRFCGEGTKDPEIFIHIEEKILNAKREMVPDCFSCASPCGRTDPFDLDRLESEQGTVRKMKEHLLDALVGFGMTNRDAGEFSREQELRIYKCLTVVGIEGISEEELRCFENVEIA